MNINDILTKNEYTKERSVNQLLDFVIQTEKKLWVWSQEHSGTKTLRKIKYQEFSRGLPDKFAHELTPFAYYAKTYYSDIPNAKFKPCYGSERYDGIITNNESQLFVEITNAIDGEIWGLQKELLIENGTSPWEHDILGVKDNKTKRIRSASDIIINDDSLQHTDIIDKIKKNIEKTVLEKCKKSLKDTLPYGRNKTILIVTFDDTVLRRSISNKDWNDFIDFKRTKINSIKHNFIKIVLFGWLDKTFID